MSAQKEKVKPFGFDGSLSDSDSEKGDVPAAPLPVKASLRYVLTNTGKRHVC
jgi:hypothetical protein